MVSSTVCDSVTFTLKKLMAEFPVVVAPRLLAGSCQRASAARRGRYRPRSPSNPSQAAAPWRPVPGKGRGPAPRSARGSHPTSVSAVGGVRGTQQALRAPARGEQTLLGVGPCPTTAADREAGAVLG